MVGYEASNGISSVCIHTLSAIYAEDGEADIRFCKEVDDPKGDEADRARKVLAVPILESQDSSKGFKLPKGVITVVNRPDDKEFDIEDIETFKAYSSLVAQVVDHTE